MSLEKNAEKNTSIERNNGVKLFVLDLDQTLAFEDGIDWQMAAVAAIAQNNGYKLTIVSSRNPVEFVSFVANDWDQKKDWQENVKLLIKKLKNISLKNVCKIFEIFKIQFDYISLAGDLIQGQTGSWLNSQLTFEKDLLTFLQQKQQSSEKISSLDIQAYIRNHAIYKSFFDAMTAKKVSDGKNAQFDMLVNRYTAANKLLAIYFVDDREKNISNFTVKFRKSDFLVKAYLYSDSKKVDVRKKIIHDLRLSGWVEKEHAVLAKKDKQDFYNLFWAYHFFSDVVKGFKFEEHHFVGELIRLWNFAVDGLIDIFLLKFPNYTHQAILEAIYNVYPFKNNNMPYQVPKIEFSQQDQKPNRGLVAKIGFAQVGHEDNNNNNINNGYNKSNQYTHFQLQQVKRFTFKDFNGPKRDFYSERGRLIVDVVLHPLKEECLRLEKIGSNVISHHLYQEILVKINALEDIYKSFDKVMNDLWLKSSLKDEDFRDKNGFYGPQDHVEELFDSFHENALGLLHNLVIQVIGVQNLNHRQIDNKALLESIAKLKDEITHEIADFKEKETKYISQRQRPVLAHEMPIHLPRKPASKFWGVHVPVGRYTNEQIVFMYYKNFLVEIDNPKVKHDFLWQQIDAFFAQHQKSSLKILKDLMGYYKAEKDEKAKPTNIIIGLFDLLDKLLINEKDPVGVNYYTSIWYELMARLITHYLDVDTAYTLPSSNRSQAGSVNSLQTYAYDLDEKGFHVYYSGFRSSSASPIDLDSKLLRLLIAYGNIHQDLELFANTNIKEIESLGESFNFASNTPSNPLVVKVGWATLLSPLGGEKMAALAEKFMQQTEYSQLFEINIVRKMLQSGPSLVEVGGRLIWAKFEIQAINRAVNEGSVVTDTFSSLQENINEEGYYLLAQSIDVNLQKFLQEGKFGPAQKLITELCQKLKTLQDDKVLLDKKQEIENLREEVNKRCAKLNLQIQKINLQNIIQGEPVNKKFLEEINEIKNYEDLLRVECNNYLQKRNSIFSDPHLADLTAELIKLLKDKNLDLQRVVDIFLLKSLMYTMIDKKDFKEYGYWFVAYYLCLLKELDPSIIIKFHCKSAEDRTGTLEDYFRAIQKFRFSYGFYPDYQKPGIIDTVDHIRKQLYEKSPNRETNNENAPGSYGLQVCGQFFQSYDDHIAKLAKKAIKAKIETETPIPLVVYNSPMLLNEKKAKFFKDKNDFTANKIRQYNANIKKLDKGTLVRELVEERKMAATSSDNIFYHDLVLRFWFFLSKATLIGVDKAILKDAEDFVKYYVDKKKSSSNGRFGLQEREILAIFFTKEVGKIKDRQDYFNTTLLELLVFVSSLKLNEINLFFRILKSSLSNNLYSSQFCRVVVEDLKENRVVVGEIYNRYILPYFYLIPGAKDTDFSGLMEQLNYVREIVKEKDNVRPDLRQKIDDDWSQCQVSIEKIADSIDIAMAESKSSEAKVFDKLNVIFYELMQNFNNIRLKISGEYDKAKYVCELSTFILEFLAKNKLSIMSSNSVQALHQSAIQFFDVAILEVFNEITRLSQQYKVHLNQLNLPAKNAGSTSLLVAMSQFLKFVWCGFECAMPNIGEKTDPSASINNLRLAAGEVFTASSSVCERLLEQLNECFPGVSGLSANSLAKEKDALLQALKKLPSELYTQVNFFERSDEANKSNGLTPVPSSNLAANVASQREKMTNKPVDGLIIANGMHK